MLPEITGNAENVIEFIKDSERVAVAFCQGQYKSRIKKLAAERPEECGDSGRESGWQLVRTYPGCMDKDKSYKTAFRARGKIQE